MSIQDEGGRADQAVRLLHPLAGSHGGRVSAITNIKIYKNVSPPNVYDANVPSTKSVSCIFLPYFQAKPRFFDGTVPGRSASVLHSTCSPGCLPRSLGASRAAPAASSSETMPAIGARRTRNPPKRGRLCDPDDRGYNVRPEKDEKDVVIKISVGTLRS